jgi:hypothetical protein
MQSLWQYRHVEWDPTMQPARPQTPVSESVIAAERPESGPTALLAVYHGTVGMAHMR